MTAVGALAGCAEPLWSAYDVALVDLDGVVYLGGEPVPGAAAALEAARGHGMRLAFVTNNASRTPDDVAARLGRLGVAATPDEVVTSAQATATLLRSQLPAGAAVLVVGGVGLRRAVGEAGLRVVDTYADRPVAVAQGYTVDLNYRELAEAALAVRAGVLWVASNGDPTIPTPRGLLPGNGALVAAVAAATGRTPVIAGKPELPLHAEAVRRTGARHPLVVGDRLDTDVEGAVRAGTPSLLVLTGVTSPAELLTAPAGRRPSYVAPDLGGLGRPQPEVEVAGTSACCGGWRATAGGEHLLLKRGEQPREGDGLDALRALCAAAWAADLQQPVRLAGPADVLAGFGLQPA